MCRRIKNLKCTNCGKTKEVEAGTIGDMEKESNFFPVLNYDCSILWLCDECKHRAFKLAKELVSLVNGDDTICLTGLVSGGIESE